VFFHKGTYYAFYATRMPDGSEHLGMASSKDGVTFHKQIPSPFEEVRPPYRHGPNRDPFVFGEGGDFHMLVTASLLHPAISDHAGVLEQLVSKDLQHWRVLPEPFLVTGHKASPECSDLFLWKGWYYLLFGEDGATHYRMAHSMTGTWIKPVNDILDSQEARVMKVAEFSGDRLIGVAFIPQGNWGGNLVFRELHQAGDGTLLLSFPPEMVPRGKPITQWKAIPEAGDVYAVDGQIILKGEKADASAMLEGLPQDFYLKAKLSPQDARKKFGFIVTGQENGIERAFRLEIDPSSGIVRWQEPATAHIDGVLDAGKPVEIEIVANGTIVDLAINGKHTLIHRLPALQQRHISLFANGGTVTATDMAVSSIQ
jgi:hypothetical protein